MKLLILSDLHLEFSLLDIDTKNADIVVLAGDIHLGTRGFAWIKSQFAHLPVIYVPGNHEFYKGEVSRVLRDMHQAAAESGHVHVLNNQSVTLDGVTFLGSSLWTDFALWGEDLLARTRSMATAAEGMTDYHTIRFEDRGSFRRLKPRDTAAFHVQSRQWLAEQLAASCENKRVVITHHAPSLLSIKPHEVEDAFSPSYASRLDALVEQADLWIHGHVHMNFDYSIGPCRVICNPRGYVRPGIPPKNSSFDPALIIEV